MDDMASREEILDWTEETGFLDRAILDARDACLLESLHTQIEASPKGPFSLAVVYGALHMRAVLRDLIGKHNYRCIGSEWMTVFSL